MRFLIDENLPFSLAQMLEEAGHDVADVVTAQLRGEDDEVIWKYAGRGHRVLIPRDLDFPMPDLHPRPAGLVLIRVPDTWTGTQIVKLVQSSFRELKLEQLERRITVLAPGHIRTHGMN